MISYNPKTWFKLIFTIDKNDTIHKMIWVVILFAVYVSFIVHFDYIFGDWILFQNVFQIHSFLGVVIGFMLVFRTNTAYDRWWEGRKLWGSLINNTRSLAVKLNTLIPMEQKELRDFFMFMIPNFCYAMKEHLRNNNSYDELELENKLINLETLKNAKHLPNNFSSQIFKKTKELEKNGTIKPEELIIVDRELFTLLDCLGACERIRNTPMPYSYNIFIKKFIFTYVVTLPFGLIHQFGYLTILIVSFIIYVYGSLEILAEEIEDPFGKDANDLPLDELCSKIRSNIKEIFENN